ncbi:uncharacterized protein LOC118432828 [Branchiostoma floridae]|uniref:Uncharacterized protein LOC118432828 n=1 Tax=Branchiostoma floridae TaxID=7739 RepID=A0A9J7NDT7_BRAFL|nr:uncharacterized protein LOC118432828 [Branchiostoma floridae]
MSDGALEKDSANSSESQDKEKTEDLKEPDPDKDVEEESEKIDTFADENSASSCHDNSTEDVEENEAVFEKDTEEALEKTMKGTMGTKAHGKKQQKLKKRTPTKTEHDKKKPAHAGRRAFKGDKKQVLKQKTRKHSPRSQCAVVKRRQFHRKPSRYKNSHGRRRGRRGGGRQAARRAPGDKNSQQSNSGSQTQTTSSAGSPSAPLPLHRTTSQSSASGDDGDGDPPRRPPSSTLQRTPLDGQVVMKREETAEEEEPPEDIVTTLTALLSDGVVFPEQDQVQQFIQALMTSYLHRQHRGAANWASCNCSSCKVVHGAVKHVTACSKPAGQCEICTAVFYCAVSHSRACNTHRLCPIAFCRDVKIKLHEVDPGPVGGIAEKLWGFLKITVKRAAPRSHHQPDLQYGASGPASLPVFPGYQLRQEYMSLPYGPGTQPPPSLPPSAMLGARPKTLDIKPAGPPLVGQQVNTFGQAGQSVMLGARPKMTQQPLPPSSEQADPKKKERKLPACLRPRGGKKEPENSPAAPVAPPRRRRKKSSIDPQEQTPQLPQGQQPPHSPPPQEDAAQNPPEELHFNVGALEGFCHDDFRLENPIGRRDVKLRHIESGGETDADDVTQNNRAAVHAYFQDRYGEMTFNDNELPCLQKATGGEERREDLVATRGDYLQQRSVQSLVSSSIQVTSSVRGLLPSYNNTLYNYSQVVAPPPDGLQLQVPSTTALPDRLSQLVSTMPSLPAEAISSLLSMVQQPVLPPLGAVSVVPPRHASIFAAHWEQLAEELLTTNRRVTNQEHEGFVLDLHAEKLPPCDDQFRLDQHWWSIMELGSGRFGTVYLSCLASEEQEFHFAAKKV